MQYMNPIEHTLGPVPTKMFRIDSALRHSLEMLTPWTRKVQEEQRDEEYSHSYGWRRDFGLAMAQSRYEAPIGHADNRRARRGGRVVLTLHLQHSSEAIIRFLHSFIRPHPSSRSSPWTDDSLWPHGTTGLSQQFEIWHTFLLPFPRSDCLISSV